MSKFRVLLTDYAWPDLEIERAILAEYDAEMTVAPSGDVETLKKLAANVDAIMTNWVDVPAAVIDAATKCRVISRLGIGLDCIDVKHATTKGIPVTNVPDYCLIEVAEHTIALLFSLGRKVHLFHANAKAGKYDLKAGFPLRRISGQTLGIVGLGNTGREVAKRAIPLGLRVLATSRSRRDPVAGVTWTDLDELLATSDYVSLHIPLTKETRHTIAATQLARMKSTAFLINTARGGLINAKALSDALANGVIAGAALDVQDPEPPNLSQTPYNDPRVIVTPHAAFYSEESVAELRRRASHQVGVRLSGGRPENVVNPEVL
jgi:D-3-phosphoglycerate dehydrogenase / 2-oxoglutarate reductase